MCVCVCVCLCVSIYVYDVHGDAVLDRFGHLEGVGRVWGECKLKKDGRVVMGKGCWCRVEDEGGVGCRMGG